ncbi:MAG TPA: ATP-binding protein [Candidatus Saccharimonadales bacterium]|nr:ATP-binding protein [Candidatus Saccharimonadales bacterium]
MSPKQIRKTRYPKRHINEIEALFASIGEGLIATDEIGKVTRINQSALDIFGYKKSEIMGERFTQKVVAVYESGKPLNVIERPIARSFLTGQVVSERVLYKRKDGSQIPAHVTVSPLIVNGKPVGSVQLIRDITSEIQMERMKSDFISLASHQLRTPLSSVNIYANMLKDGLGGDMTELQNTFVDTILASAKRMNELIDTLLNITRVETKGIEISPGLVDMKSLIHEILTEIKPVIQEKKLSLQFRERYKILVSTDKQLAKEVLVNILTNAVKYTPSGGKILIKIEKSGANIIISIKDSGYGIPLNAQAHIFTKFFRANNILSHDVSGTGLGLYLTKMIAESLGGDLWFDSIENKGTTFYFSLPVTL